MEPDLLKGGICHFSLVKAYINELEISKIKETKQNEEITCIVYNYCSMQNN